MGEEELCRLCAESKSAADLLSIKDDYWTQQNLELKISQFFQIKISEDDKLPKCVCSKCCEKVIITSDFNEKVQQAQETLKSAFIDDDKDFDSESLAATIQNETSNSPSAGLVECVLTDSLKDTQRTKMTRENETVPDISLTVNAPKRKKKVNDCTNEEDIKRRPSRTKARKSKKKSVDVQAEEVLTDTEDDSSSVLSGVSGIERNEDGSLILREGGLVLRDGLESLEGWDSYPWLCADCDEKPVNIMALRTHHQTVHNQMPRYVCVECPKVYTKYYGFISHVRCHRYHLKFCCDACNKFFPNRKLLETHRATHFDARPYVCTTCGKGFRMQSALYVHARSHLPLEVKNKYPCDQCPKRFGTKPNLMAHKRIHTGIRDYTCDQCGKSFIQKGNLDNHLLTHIAARPYSCEICGKAFKTLMRLKKHGSVHSGLKPHQCDVCGRQFRERGTLKEHHRIHTGAMPFTCEFCGKCFRFKGVLTTHRRQHTGERPYSCQECQHHFTNWPNYNKHMKRRHGINTSVTTRKPQTIPPTGMPNRNPPGTVIAPSAGVLVIQDTNSIQSSTSYIEQDQQTFISQGTITNQRDRIQPVSMTTSNITGQIVNMQPAHITQGYYMSGMLSLYNIQGMDPTEIMTTQQTR